MQLSYVFSQKTFCKIILYKVALPSMLVFVLQFVRDSWSCMATPDLRLCIPQYYIMIICGSWDITHLLLHLEGLNMTILTQLL